MDLHPRKQPKQWHLKNLSTATLLWENIMYNEDPRNFITSVSYDYLMPTCLDNNIKASPLLLRSTPPVPAVPGFLISAPLALNFNIPPWGKLFDFLTLQGPQHNETYNYAYLPTLN